jgi:hypothetical protein
MVGSRDVIESKHVNRAHDLPGIFFLESSLRSLALGTELHSQSEAGI